MSNCILCEVELIKNSEDSVYCPNKTCQRYGVDTAVGKDENGVEIELRTGEPT
jgi:hypothetical protein